MSSARRFDILRTLLSVLIALAISFLIILFVSDQPFEAIKYLLIGPLTSKRNLGTVVESMIPLIFTGTGVCIMFSANQINLASEGAFHVGGLVASCVAIYVTADFVSPVLALVCAGLVGAMFTAIPAVMKITTSTNEMVSSLMINYIALYFGTYMINNVIGDPAASTASYALSDASELPTLISGTRVHLGIVIALVVAVLGYFFLYRTKIGYELRLTGENGEFARYSGISIVKVVMISQLLGGFVAGLGGGVEMLSPIYSRFTWTSLLGYGWDAIVICTLSKKNPLYTPLAALFLAYLRTGASIMARRTDVSLEIVQITQGIIILLVVAEQFLSKYKHRMIAKESKAALKEEEA
ncbi:MAG: ABC transporter permease [Clostridiales bacterium]|nr:ABC transporter permease [Clostridiales bacterium]